MVAGTQTLNSLQQPRRPHFQEYFVPPFVAIFAIFCTFYSWKYIPVYLLACFIGYILARVAYVQYVWGDLFKTMPHPPRKLLTGSARLLQPGQTFKQFKEWVDQYGEVLGFKLLPLMTPMVIVASPDALRTIMATNNIPKGSTLGLLEKGISFGAPEGSGWLGTGLVTSNGGLWKARRNLITPAFHFQILQNYMYIFVSRTNIMVSNLNKLLAEKNASSSVEGSSIDLFPHNKNLTLDIISSCAFGIDMGSQTSNAPNDYVDAIEQLSALLFRRSTNPLYQISWIFRLLPMGREWNKLTNTIHQLPDRLIQERRKYIAEHPEVTEKRRLDFLDILLTLEDENGESLSDRAIREEANTFLFAGHDTTAAGLSWILYCLAQNPECQRKAREEVLGLLGDREAPTYEEAKSGLSYLESCIKETFRMYPPVPINVRYADVPLELDGYHVPAQTEMYIPIYAVHRNPKYWKNPDTFNPDRFTTDGISHPYSYIPFSAGYRSCIGQIFAMLEEKTILALLLKNFEFTLDESHQVVPETFMVLRPRKETGLHLFVKPYVSAKSHGDVLLQQPEFLHKISSPTEKTLSSPKTDAPERTPVTVR